MAGRGNLFSQDHPTSRYLKAFDLTQVLTDFGSTFEVSKPSFILRFVRLLFVHLSHGWCKCESAQTSTGLEREITFEPHTSVA